jgi:hypothetical protein
MLAGVSRSLGEDPLLGSTPEISVISPRVGKREAGADEFLHAPNR